MSQQEVIATLVRVFHAFWQTFLGVFLLGLTPVVSDVLKTGSISGAKAALLALVAAAAAAGFSTIKNVIVKPVEAK